MKIVYTQPPNYEEILRHFTPPRNAVFVYGDTCYCPDGRALGVDVAEHELVHVEQQGKDPAGWWQKFFDDPQFRLEQELQAYRRQYQFASIHLTDRNKLIVYARGLASDLASPMYHANLTVSEALRLIRQ